MRILVGKTFGIGNSILCIPLLKALNSLGHKVDVLVGTTDDDFGAVDIFKALRQETEVIGHVYRDGVPFDVPGYDLAIMAIPFDGRWQNGLHFFAKEVVDCRKRPDNVERLGFDMWKKHEVEYMLENALTLGFDGKHRILHRDADFGTSFLPEGQKDFDYVYVGLGFKRDAGGFGESKHFGDQRFAELISEIRRLRPHTRFYSTGSAADMFTFYRIVKILGHGYSDYYNFNAGGLQRMFDIMPRVWAYIGNDTGSMHCAASCNAATFGLFKYPDLTVKNPPFCEKSQCLVFDDTTDPKEVARQFVEFTWKPEDR